MDRDEINHHRKCEPKRRTGSAVTAGYRKSLFPNKKETMPKRVERAAPRGKRRETFLSKKISHGEARPALRVHQINFSLYVGVWRLRWYKNIQYIQVPFQQNSSVGDACPQSKG